MKATVSSQCWHRSLSVARYGFRAALPSTATLPELVKRTGRPAANKPISTGTREDQNYFFRVRTVFDEKKQVKSALYGKLLGDLEFWGTRSFGLLTT